MADLDRVRTACAACVDRAVLRAMEWVWTVGNATGRSPAPNGQDALETYIALGAATASAAYAEPGPAELELVAARARRGGRTERYRWRSGYRTWDPSRQHAFDRFRENGWAHIEWHRHDQPNVTVLCLHAWLAGSYALARRFFGWLYGAGFDVVLFALPFDGPRTPHQARFGGQLFPGRSLWRNNEGFGQLVWDARALVRRLERDGGGPVGVAGMSLGGYGAALLASVEPRLAFAIPIVPVVDMVDLMWRHGGHRSERLRRETGGRSLEQMRALYAVHAPLGRAPVVPRERRLIIAGLGDRICEPAHVRLLWEHWERPAIHWWPGGHVAQLGRGACAEPIQRLIASVRN